MANKKITDATTATSVAGTDKVFLNQGGDLKQIDLNSAVANSQAVQTLNRNLNVTVKLSDLVTGTIFAQKVSNLVIVTFVNISLSEGGMNKLICSGLPKANKRQFGVLISRTSKEHALVHISRDDFTSIQGNFKSLAQEQNYYGQLVYFCE